MKFEDMKINMNQFYNLGIVCFIVIALANTVALFDVWSSITLWGKISSSASIIFNFGLAGFFNYLKSTMPKQDVMDQVPKDLDIDKMIDNF